MRILQIQTLDIEPVFFALYYLRHHFLKFGFLKRKEIILSNRNLLFSSSSSSSSIY